MNYTTFEDFAISEEIVTALKALRYFKPTQVQQEVIPLTLKGKDIIVESQTGSGKTVSFGVPLCESVNWEENRPQALILVPTRELALQVKEDITNIGRLKRIKATAVFGKTSFDTQKSELRQKSHIVVGTPGRVLDHLQKGTMKFDKIRYLVLDEADEMLNMGFIEQVEAIIDFLPKQRQTLLFSATMPNEVVRLASFYMKNDRVSVKMESDEASKPKILQSFIRVQESGKPKQLLDLLTVENPDSCIIFCNTQEAVNGLYTFLSKAGLPIDMMHGGMVQDDRTAVMEDFRKGRLRYLVATDVAARGIDVDNVTHVVNYDVPEEKESFIHRTGRTGRAGKTGIALTLVTPNEERSWQAVKDFAQQEITEIDPPSARFVQHHKATFEKKLQERPVIKQRTQPGIEQGHHQSLFQRRQEEKTARHRFRRHADQYSRHRCG
jgi:ATP-dependent RNA helicase DeaD